MDPDELQVIYKITDEGGEYVKLELQNYDLKDNEYYIDDFEEELNDADEYCTTSDEENNEENEAEDEDDGGITHIPPNTIIYR